MRLRSPISWVGGKRLLRDAIYERMPLSYEKYVEVFGGAAWVLFGMKNVCGFEVYNDMNSNLVNFFRCVRERPMELILELGFLPLTSREEYKMLHKFLRKKRFPVDYVERQVEIAEEYLDEPEAAEIIQLLRERNRDTDILRAVAFYKSIRYSYASKGVTFACKPYNIFNAFTLIWAANWRLRRTVIENKDFGKLIEHYDSPGTFFYLDPPYFGTEDYYTGVNFSAEGHQRLRDTLANVQGMWLLSYNDDPYIRELYADYHIESIERLDNMAQRFDQGKMYPEVLISNYDTTLRRKVEETVPTQTSLF